MLSILDLVSLCFFGLTYCFVPPCFFDPLVVGIYFLQGKGVECGKKLGVISVWVGVVCYEGRMGLRFSG